MPFLTPIQQCYCTEAIAILSLLFKENQDIKKIFLEMMLLDGSQFISFTASLLITVRQRPIAASGLSYWCRSICMFCLLLPLVFLCLHQHSVAEGIMFLGCSCVRPKRFKHSVLKTKGHFHQTFSIVVVWDKDERFKFWDQKVKVQSCM